MLKDCDVAHSNQSSSVLLYLICLFNKKITSTEPDLPLETYYSSPLHRL